MVAPVTALAVALILAAGDRYLRRHPAWDLCPRARFRINCGYPMVAISAYFFVDAAFDTAWAVGAVWAVAAVVMFTTGVGALEGVLRRQHRTASSMETIADTAAMRARS